MSDYDSNAINAIGSPWARAKPHCSKCDGAGLISGDDEDGVYFGTCPKCDGSGYQRDEKKEKQQ